MVLSVPHVVDDGRIDTGLACLIVVMREPGARPQMVSNIRLAFWRALAVANVLIEAGVPAETMTITAKEEMEGLMPTRDEQIEMANRAVMFDWVWQ